MKKCPKCGNILDEDANACGTCGVWLADVGGALEVEATPADDVSSSAEDETQPHDDIPADKPTELDSVSASLDDGSVEEMVDTIEKDMWKILQGVVKFSTDVEKSIPSTEEFEADMSKMADSVNVDDGKSGDERSSAGRFFGNGQGRSPNPFVVKEIPDEGPGACKYLLVEYNWNSFSIEDMQNSLYFRLTPLADQDGDGHDFSLRHVNFYYWIVKDPAKVNFVRVPLLVKLRQNTPINVSVPIREKAGIYNITFKVECLTDGGKESYIFELQKHIVIARNSDNTSQIAIYPHNITASEAGQINFDFSKFENPNVSFEEKLELLYTLPPAYGRKALLEMSDVDPVNGLERILLRVAGYALYVIGKPSMKIGRLPKWAREDVNKKIIKSTNDLVVRIPGLSPDVEPNSTVSATHGILSIFNGTLTYQDTSSYGSSIDYGDWFMKECRRLPADRSSIVEFGDIPLELNPCTCGRREDDEICRDCGQRPGGVCSTILWRRDKVPEIYLMVPICCDLGKVLPQMKGWILYKTDNGFEVRKPNGASCPLNIGDTLTYEGVSMVVEEFRQ